MNHPPSPKRYVLIMTTHLADLSVSVPTTNNNNFAEAIPMFKSEHGFNINVADLQKTFHEQGIDAIRTIAIPSVVREQHRGEERCETPTLSEVGVVSVTARNGFDFCQVIAGTDGRPVNIDNVLFVNKDPSKSSIIHGTAGVEIGSYFSIGWKRKADCLILLYHVTACELFMSVEDQKMIQSKEPSVQDATKIKKIHPIAKLTCALSGHMVRTWRGETSDVPDELLALHVATEARLQSNYPVPGYMDMIRMVATTDDSVATAKALRNCEYSKPEVYTPDIFVNKIYREILEIRQHQYQNPEITADGKRRKIGPVRAVETLTLDREDNTVQIDLVILRDDISPIHFQTTLTQDNFFGQDGRVTLERGLVLKCTSFDKLRSELENRRVDLVSVNLASIR